MWQQLCLCLFPSYLLKQDWALLQCVTALWPKHCDYWFFFRKCNDSWDCRGFTSEAVLMFGFLSAVFTLAAAQKVLQHFLFVCLMCLKISLRVHSDLLCGFEVFLQKHIEYNWNLSFKSFLSFSFLPGFYFFMCLIFCFLICKHKWWNRTGHCCSVRLHCDPNTVITDFS